MRRACWLVPAAVAGAAVAAPEVVAAIVAVAVVAAVTSGTRMLRPDRRRLGDGLTRLEVVRAATALLLLSVTVVLRSAGPASWLLAGLGVVAVTVAAGSRPTGSRLVVLTAGATLGTLVTAALAAVSTVAGAPFPPILPALLATAAWVAAAWVVAASSPGHVGDVRYRLTAVAAALTAVVPAATILADGWTADASAVAAGAAGATLLAATTGRVGDAVARALPVGMVDHGETVGELRVVAAAVLGVPVVAALAAAVAGALPAGPVLALAAPVVPAGGHLAVIARRRADRAAAATRDALTGLPNEQVFTDALERRLALARRDRRPLAVAFLDLDGFKAVNDRHGHDVGDALLIEVAGRLRATVRDVDLVARRSGDEFLVLLPEVGDRAGAGRVASRVAAAVASPVVIGAHHLDVGASVGLAMWPDDAPTAGALLAAADAAMYDAKATGGGDPVRWCSVASTARDRVAATLRSDLTTMIERGGLEVDLAPVVRFDDRHPIAWHVQASWPHPELGRLTPATYLPLLVDPVAARAYDGAVLAAGLAAAPDDREGPLTVPLTAASLEDEQLPARVAAALAADGRPGSRLRIAIDAGTVRRAGPSLLRVANQLRDLGVELVVTDVGDDHLAIRELAALPLASVEISWGLAAAHRRSTDRAVLAALCASFHAWDLPVTAAGIDGPSCVRRLREVGIEAGRLAGPQVALDDPSLRREAVTARTRDLDTLARALLEGRVEVSGDEVDTVVTRLLGEPQPTAA